MKLEEALQKIASDWHAVDDKTHVADGDGLSWRVEDGFGGIGLTCSGLDEDGKPEVVLKKAVSHNHKLPELADRMRAAVKLLRGELP